MKSKIKYVALLLAVIFITIGISVILLQTPSNRNVKIYEIVDENVKMVDFSKLKTGQTIQCDIRLSVTLEKINSFHDCRQIFILPDEWLG